MHALWLLFSSAAALAINTERKEAGNGGHNIPALKECLRLLSQRTNAMSLFKHIILAVVKHRGRCLAVSMIEHTGLHACIPAVLEGQPWAHPYLQGNQNWLQTFFFFFFG